MHRVRSAKWIAIFVLFVVLIMAVIGFMMVFAYFNGIPFLNSEKTFSVQVPFSFYEKGQLPDYPNYEVWVNFTTQNTVGHEFIAGQKINVNAILLVGNQSNPFLSPSPTFILTFQDALVWGFHLNLTTPSLKMSVTSPFAFKFYNVAGSNVWRTNVCCANIYFPFEGSYAPILYVYNNITSPATTILTENSTFIPIESPSAINTQSYNQINEALTYALVFFGLVELRTPLRETYRRAFSDFEEQPREEFRYNQD